MACLRLLSHGVVVEFRPFYDPNIIPWGNTRDWGITPWGNNGKSIFFLNLSEIELLWLF
jgi:hypothetical protein